VIDVESYKTVVRTPKDASVSELASTFELPTNVVLYTEFHT